MWPGAAQSLWVRPPASPAAIPTLPVGRAKPAAFSGPSPRFLHSHVGGNVGVEAAWVINGRSARRATNHDNHDHTAHAEHAAAAVQSTTQRDAIVAADEANIPSPLEWSVEQVFSIVSGVVASLCSIGAYSRQREATKARASDEGSEAPGKNVRLVQQLGGSLLDAEAESPLFSLGPVPRCTAASDLRQPGRHFTIITTAALPWLTGTAVNPLLRALGLARGQKPVVLVLPWIEQDLQQNLFPGGQTFATPEEQELVILKWCKERAGTDVSKLPLTFRWYEAFYVPFLRSIFPSSDVSSLFGANDPKDVLILEEPEHLCWYHHGQRWPCLFRHVIGIVHTNYQDLMCTNQDDWPDSVKEASVHAASTLVCSAYCDVNIKLSDTLMPLPNEVTCNVHGVRDEFLKVGDMMTAGGATHNGGPAQPKDPSVADGYYIGKGVMGKGWGELLDFLDAAGTQLGGFRMDGYGSGPDSELIGERVGGLPEGGATVRMHPGRDHADPAIHQYGVLVNPSTTDVLCTVTVEALAMGKQCVLAKHPSNRFFETYFSERCHFFRPGDTKGFVQAVRDAQAAGKPQALPPALRYLLTWEAACERLFNSAEVRVLSGPCQRPSEAAVSMLAYRLHFDLMQDGNVAADIIRDATFGQSTPWDKYLNKWRTTQMNRLKQQAWKPLQMPAHIQEHEEYLRDSIAELSDLLRPNGR